MNLIISAVASLIVGGAVASVTVVSLVSSQSAAPSKSPANVQQSQIIEYGTVSE